MLFLLSNPWRTGVLALGTVVAALGLYAHHEHHELLASRQALVETKANYVQAQVAATELATTLKSQQEARDAARKETADAQLAQDSSHDRTDADAYAAAHSVRWAGAAQGSAGHADLPGPGAAAQGDNRSGATADMDAIVVNHGDFDICTVNSRRLQVAHDWGVSQ